MEELVAVSLLLSNKIDLNKIERVLRAKVKMAS